MAIAPCSDHMERGLDLRCLIALRCERASRGQQFSKSKIFQNRFSPINARSSGSARFPVGSLTRHCGARYPWGTANYWGRTSVGQDVVEQNLVGQNVTGAIS